MKVKIILVVDAGISTSYSGDRMKILNGIDANQFLKTKMNELCSTQKNYRP